MPTDIALHLGGRLRARRLELELTLEQVSERMQKDITLQQIQKYEVAAHRIPAERLWQFAKTLDVPIGYFFEGFVEIPSPPSRRFVYVSQKDAHQAH